MSLGLRDVWPSNLDDPPKPSLNDVVRTLRLIQELNPSGAVTVDGVRWEPACGRWSCWCAIPSAAPCSLWMGKRLGEGTEQRCPRCGWPRHRHLEVRGKVQREPFHWLWWAFCSCGWDQREETRQGAQYAWDEHYRDDHVLAET